LTIDHVSVVNGQVLTPSHLRGVNVTPTILIHGGAGRMPSMDRSRGSRFRATMRAGAELGGRVLLDGGSPLDAVVEANVLMEDSGVFNGGLGSVLTAEGRIEMDAAVMRGSDRGYGAVAGVTGLRSPVRLARAVMERTPHCMLIGAVAEALAREVGLPLREDFPSAERLADWRRRRALMDETKHMNLAERVAALGGVLGEEVEEAEHEPVGSGDTVGVIALDASGSVAVGDTTGGIWMKLPGRVGDSPLPGAGLWAVDGQGAAMATGIGEPILKCLLSKEAVDRIPTLGAQGAADGALALMEASFGPEIGGVLCVGCGGDVGFAFHTRGMGRALWQGGMDEAAVGVWPGEDWDRPLPG